MQDIELSTSVFVSILQIYNENINDLLSKTVDKNLQIRMDKQNQYYVQNL